MVSAATALGPELPPTVSEATAVRKRLIDRLRATAEVPVVLVCAPAGYGKTMLLRQWVEEDPRPVAWLDVAAADDDPRRLLRSISRALSDISVTTVRSRSFRGPAEFALVLDNAHLVRSPASLTLIEALAARLPRRCQLLLASRGEPRLAVARMRARGELVDLNARDLAMTAVEVATLLRGARAEVSATLRETEGWAAGVVFARGSGGRCLEDLARSAFLADAAPEVVTFLRRTSVLETLTGPACDALLRRSDSARTLRKLERGGLPLVALDRHDESFRLLGPLARAMRADLARVDGELEGRLHRLATSWFAAAGDLDRAIGHALAGGDPERAGELVWAGAGGGDRALRRRLGDLSDAQLAKSPLLACAAAAVNLADGRVDLVRQWIAAGSSAHGAPREQRPSLRAAHRIGQAAVARDGLARMAEDARNGSQFAPDGSPWRSVCCFLEGVSLHLTGDREKARAKLEEAVRRGAVSALQSEALSLAQLGLLAAEKDDWPTAEAAAVRAERLVSGEQPGVALVWALSALVHATAERFDAAHVAITRAALLHAQLVEPPSWYEAELAIALARAALRLGDPGQARKLLARGARAGRELPDAVVLQEWLAATETQLASFGDAADAPPPLTPAELRILPHLASHLSFREVGQRLFVSSNTVKTQSLAIYRKLEVCSRSEAVRRARELGLLA